MKRKQIQGVGKVQSITKSREIESAIPESTEASDDGVSTDRTSSLCSAQNLQQEHTAEAPLLPRLLPLTHTKLRAGSSCRSARRRNRSSRLSKPPSGRRRSRRRSRRRWRLPARAAAGSRRRQQRPPPRT